MPHVSYEFKSIWLVHTQLKRLLVAISLLIISLLIGVVGYVTIEDFAIVDAFYMSIITMSTVGFGEVQDLSREGRVFTAIYIVFNLGIFAYAVSVLTSYLFEGKLNSVFRNYMSVREISKLKNHVIVCGYGRNGREACSELIKAGRSFVVIEKDERIRQNLEPEAGFEIITGDAVSDESLRLAGVDRARQMIITTPSDADNVFITLTARELKPDITIISRATRQETESKLYRAGANHVVLPDHLGGMFMAQMVTKPVVIEFLDLLTGRNRDERKFILEAVSYENLKEQCRDKTIKELSLNYLQDANIIAMKDNEKGLIPNPSSDSVVGENDTIIILCAEDRVSQLLADLTK